MLVTLSRLLSFWDVSSLCETCLISRFEDVQELSFVFVSSLLFSSPAWVFTVRLLADVS